MTLVQMDLEVPATGTITYSRTNDNDIATIAVGTELELTPTGVDWAWLFVERTTNGVHRRWCAVPDVVGPINYVDLVDVDPDTLNPTTPVIPAYQALFDAEEAARETGDNTNANAIIALADLVDDKADAAATTASLAGKQPLDADLTAIAALAPTNGQILSYNTTLGAWTVTNPIGSSLNASATVIGATTPFTSVAATVTGSAISVTDSGGRPVVLDFDGGFVQTTVGTGTVYFMVYETTGAATHRASAKVALPNSTAANLATLSCGLHRLPIGVVTTTRTFELRAIILVGTGTPTASVANSATMPSTLQAINQ